MAAERGVGRVRLTRPSRLARVIGLGTIYGKTLRDSRRAILLVGLLGGGFMLLTAAPYGVEFTTAASRQALVAQMTALPAVFRGLLGEPINIDTLGGFLSWRTGNVLPVMLGMWSVVALSGTLAGEAARGSLDLLASTPQSRRSIALQKLGAHLTGVVIAMALTALLTWIGGRAFAVLPGDEIPVAAAVGFALLAGLLMLASGAVAFALGPFVGRTRALGFGLVTLFGGYLIASYAALAPQLDALSPLSWYAWTEHHRPLAGVTDWPPVVLLALATVVLLAIGVVGFERVDVGQAGRLGWLRLPGLPAGILGPFMRQFSDRLAAALAWGLGIGVYGALIAGSAKQFAESIGSLPQMADLIRLVYPDIDINEPSGLLQLAFYAFGSLMIGLAGVTFLAGWATDEGNGRLDVVLSTPLSRAGWALRSGLGVMAAIASTTLVLAALLSVGIVAAGGSIVEPVLGSGVLGLAAAGFAGVGLAAGGLVRSSLAAPVAAALVIGTFLLDTLGAALDLPDAVLDLSIFRHLGQPIAGSYDPVGLVVAGVLAVGGVLLGAWGMQRRDIGE